MKLSVEQISRENEEEVIISRHIMLSTFLCVCCSILLPNCRWFLFRQMHPLHPGVHGYISRLLFQDRTDFERLVDSHNLACGSFGSGFAAPCTPLGILVRTTGCHHLCQLYSGGENPLASGQFRSEHPNRHPDQ